MSARLRICSQNFSTCLSPYFSYPGNGRHIYEQVLMTEAKAILRERQRTVEAFAHHCRDKSSLSARQVHEVLIPYERLFGPYARHWLVEDGWQGRLALKLALAEEVDARPRAS
jgi:hypothetical protein